MSINNQQKPGYKHTPLGWLPEDWEAVKLKSICSVNQGLQIPIEDRLKEQVDGAKVYITIQYLNNGKDAEFIKAASKSVCCDEDDVLMTRTGNTGIVVTGVHGVFHNNFFKINYDKQRINKTYLIEYLNDHKTKHTILVKAGTSTIPDLNHKDFYSIYFPLPPLSEQRKIAAIFSTWDEAITKTQQLIAQLQQRNKGLTQQLLTGKKRLKEFEGDIDLHHLKEFITEVSEKNSNRLVERVLSVTNSRGFINQAEQFDREVASEDRSNYKIVRKGQFAYNPSRVNVGSLDLLRNFDEGILSPMYVVFETDHNRLLPAFLYYHLKSHWFYGHIPMYVQGSVRDSLSFDGLTAMKFFIPTVEEQSTIVQILDSAHDEVKLYEQKLAVLQQQKKGLMQKLLTGEVRVKIDNNQN
ncbi:hypothetical protein GCM10027036_07690 [Flavihumibacter cheonanensis]|uniref:restriction endonuclease subunit S n=1 Tax=Flavihumibacter cheonanensis TaxID=1442385 RepID=UPI001EF936F6|nr:restriction endonuclease subunit S [Flavihumibacter cheonanensis]MCG7751789.1 restriction endonuclease subunit S [Flavihumibacter cheonanensis]